MDPSYPWIFIKIFLRWSLCLYSFTNPENNHIFIPRLYITFVSSAPWNSENSCASWSILNLSYINPQINKIFILWSDKTSDSSSCGSLSHAPAPQIFCNQGSYQDCWNKPEYDRRKSLSLLTCPENKYLSSWPMGHFNTIQRWSEMFYWKCSPFI